MAHLVQSPASGSYWVPTLTEFSITSANGTGELLAWGASTPDDWHFTISLEGGIDPRIVCNARRGPTPDLVLFRLRGVRSGDVLALYVNTNFADAAKDAEWAKYSGSVKVTVVAAAAAAEEAENADLVPRYTPVPRIRMSSYGSEQRDPPMSEGDWKTSIVSVLDGLNANPTSKIVLGLLPDPTTIYPYIPSNKNAYSSVLFTPANFQAGMRPGAGPDEILLHEFIHCCETDVEAYADEPGWKFSGTDFLTVNATNVYSCLLGRGLRKDHAGFAHLPQEYFTDPKKHYELFKKNYDIAWKRAPKLCDALRRASDRWNPFKYK